MAHPYHHSISRVKKWGGKVEDYIRIHEWFDESKKIIADFRHRALRHHAEGIFMAETIFGSTITLSTGRIIPTRWVGEQHVREDLGFIPSFADWVYPALGLAESLFGPIAKSSTYALDVYICCITDPRTKPSKTADGQRTEPILFSSADFTSRVKASHHRRAMILFIALPETKDNSNPG